MVVGPFQLLPGGVGLVDAFFKNPPLAAYTDPSQFVSPPLTCLRFRAAP